MESIQEQLFEYGKENVWLNEIKNRDSLKILKFLRSNHLTLLRETMLRLSFLR